jgi:hypothetical protein
LAQAEILPRLPEQAHLKVEKIPIQHRVKKTKHSRLRIALIVAVLPMALYLGIGLRYALYTPEQSDNYIWGAYHVHSRMSDGLLDPAGIALQARAARDSFIILTDHGTPNHAASSISEVIDGVHFTGGSEVGLPEGHFTFFGAKAIPRFDLPQYPPAAMDDAREWGAVPVLAYPSSPRTEWRYWDADLHPAGIEAMNLFSQLLETSKLQRIQMIIFAPFSSYQFLTTMHYPSTSFARWDKFLQRDKTWGFLAVDAHGGFRIRQLKSHPFAFPSYRTAFSMAAIGVSRRYADHPEDALRIGDFFNCIRGAGEPQQFDFYAANGDQQVSMGGEAPVGSSLHIRLRMIHQATRIVLRKDGAVFATSDTGDLDLAEAPAGVYRVEAYLPKHPLLPADVPWIFSNPIFVGTKGPRTTEAAEAEPSRLETLALADFHPDSDQSSRVSLMPTAGGQAFSCELGAHPNGAPAHWCALRYEKPLDLSGTSGFFLVATADTYLRYTVELAARDGIHSASCKVYPGQSTTCRIPYREFYDAAGGPLVPAAAFVNSLALRVLSGATGSGFDSSLQIRQIGFYSNTPENAHVAVLMRQ